MNKNRVATLSVLTSGLLAALSVQATAQTKVNIAHVLAADFLPVFVAKESGCFTSKGIDATLTLLPIASNIPAAIVSGSVQIGMSTPTIILQAVENGLDLVAIAGSSRMAASNPTMSVVMRQDVKVASAADLKGKKIGVPGINSLGDIVFKKWLKNSKLAAGDVTIVEAAIPQMADLLKGGTVDGVVVMEPIRTRITAANIGYRHPVEYYPATAPDSVLTTWISTGAWAKANGAAISALRACITQSIEEIKAKPDDAKRIEAKYLKFNAPTYPVFEATVKPADFKVHVDISTDMGILKKPANLEAIVLP